MTCPYCAEEIRGTPLLCPHCSRDLRGEINLAPRSDATFWGVKRLLMALAVIGWWLSWR